MRWKPRLGPKQCQWKGQSVSGNFEVDTRYYPGYSTMSYLNSQSSDVVVLQTFIDEEAETERLHDHILCFSLLQINNSDLLGRKTHIQNPE